MLSLVDVRVIRTVIYLQGGGVVSRRARAEEIDACDVLPIVKFTM